jgi:hypothetical protein
MARPVSNHEDVVLLVATLFCPGAGSTSEEKSGGESYLLNQIDRKLF